MTSVTFANSRERKEARETSTSACCTRSIESGQPGTAGYVSVTITKCQGVATDSAAKVVACHKLLRQRQRQLKD